MTQEGRKHIHCESPHEKRKLPPRKRNYKVTEKKTGLKIKWKEDNNVQKHAHLVVEEGIMKQKPTRREERNQSHIDRKRAGFAMRI